jgi:F-type H+-transporting ATPase subunit b
VKRRTILVAGSLLAWASPALAAGGADIGADSVPWGDMIEAFVNFALFLFILVRFGKKPLTEYLQKRSRTISTQLDEAKRLREEAEATLAEYRTKLEGFDEERKAITEGYRREAERESEAIIEEAKRHAERLRRDADLVIEHDIKQAQRELRGRIVDEAVSLARKVIEDRLDAGAKQKLVDHYTDSLGELPKSA